MNRIPYRIVIRESVQRKTRRIPKLVLERLYQRIADLAGNPFPVGVEKIQGSDLYRIRVGNYRIVYEVAAQIRIITIIRIGHRKDVYREM